MSGIRYNVNKKFHLLQNKTRNWEPDAAELAHYRLVVILSGKGYFALEGTILQYQEGGIIFLKPEQHPIFQEDTGTEIFVISFDTYLSNDFLQKKELAPDFADIYKQAENLCNGYLLIQGMPLPNERDGKIIMYLVEQMSVEIAQLPASHIKLIRNSIEMIVTILARNNFRTNKVQDKPSQQVLAESIVTYLKRELQTKRNVRIPDVLMRFEISEDVANLCVFNKTGMSLRKFILKYKTDLFKSRMLKMDLM